MIESNTRTYILVLANKERCISDIHNHLPLQCSSSTSNTTVLSDGTEGGNPFFPNAWFDLQVSLQISPDVIVDTPISSPLTTSPT